MAEDRNAALMARDLQHLVHPLQYDPTHATGRVWVRGVGAWLEDANGERFLDGLSGLWNVSAGHGRRELVDAAARQMAELGYASGYSGSTNPRAIELAERLAGLTQPGIERFFFTSGGAEASDTSFKIARSYWKARGRPQKTKVIAREWAYHGVTLAAMSATGMSPYWDAFEPRVPGFVHIRSPYPYRYEAPPGMSPGVAAAEELEQAIQREGPENVAMFIAEPVQGAGGVIVPPADYFPRIREICDRYDVLLAADEVITGFGRTGRMFGMEHWRVTPDLMQFAKAVTSGYFPLGGVGMRADVAAAITGGDSPWMHAYTYSGHPVGCAVALAMLDLVEREDFPALAAAKGTRLLNGLREALADHPHVGEVRGLGLMVGVELVRERETATAFDPAERVGPRVLAQAIERGLFTRVRGDVLCLAPPMITSEAEIDRIVAIVRDAVVAALGR